LQRGVPARAPAVNCRERGSVIKRERFLLEVVRHSITRLGSVAGSLSATENATRNLRKGLQT
jgi:hypothetical protein